MKKISALFIILLVIISVVSCRKRVGPEQIQLKQADSSNSSSVPRLEPDTDSVSAASNTIYFAENTLSVEELYEAVHNLSGGALAVSTVNADGSPNLAYIGPDMVDDDVLMFGLSDNQTRRNIIERKIAVAGVYLYTSDRDGGLADSRGARLVLRLIEDEDEISKLKERSPDAPDDVLFMRLVKILPVG